MKHRNYLYALLLLSSPTISEVTFDTPQGNLKLYGDVEINVDAASRTGQLTSLKTDNAERWDVNGRVLIVLDGYRISESNLFSGFSVQPLADLSGSVNLDDAVFFFGQENNWKIKIGRYEAYDMFPLNQDTFVEHSGNSANDLYEDGYGYIYMMKEGRGRGSGGAIQLSKMSGPFYFELNTTARNGTSFFQGNNYHGNSLENKKNVIYIRPVIALTVNEITTAIGMESNIVNNAYGYTGNDGKFNDQSKRNGYGATLTWNGQNANPDGGMIVSLSAAYLDAIGEKNFSTGVNALWHDFELGYIYAKNDIKEFNVNSVGIRNANELILGKYNINTVHTSYRIRDVLNMKNFDIYLGTYWSRISMNEMHDNRDRYGARVRFKYYF